MYNIDDVKAIYDTAKVCDKEVDIEQAAYNPPFSSGVFKFGRVIDVSEPYLKMNYYRNDIQDTVHKSVYKSRSSTVITIIDGDDVYGGTVNDIEEGDLVCTSIETLCFVYK